MLPGIISAAMQSRNSVIAVWTPWIVVFRSLLMLLIATFMLEPAKLATNCVSASGASIRREDAELALGPPGGCAPASPEMSVAPAPTRHRSIRAPSTLGVSEEGLIFGAENMSRAGG